MEKFKVSADDTKAEIRYLHTTVKNINRKVLAWQILCCSADPKLKDGIVELQILQADDTPCKMTEPAKWELDNIPPCSVNQPYKFSGKLVFIINTGGIEKSTI